MAIQTATITSPSLCMNEDEVLAEHQKNAFIETSAMLNSAVDLDLKEVDQYVALRCLPINSTPMWTRPPMCDLE